MRKEKQGNQREKEKNKLEMKILETMKSKIMQRIIAMKRIYLFMLLATFIYSCDRPSPSRIDFDYQLDWGGDRICVALNYLPTHRGFDTLYYGSLDFGGQSDIFGCVKNLTVVGAEFVADSANRVLILDVKSLKPIQIHYDIASHLPNDNLNCPMEMFRPNISSDFIYCHGINLFFRHADSDTTIATQRVSWGKRPDFSLFCMYHPADAFETVTGDATDFHSTLLVGDRDLNIDTITVCNALNYVVTAPRKNVQYNRQSIKEYFAKFYSGIVKFWEEDTLDSYSLVVYPFEKIPFNASGTGLNNGFCSRYDAAADTILTESRINLFSHEIGHNWISSDMDNQWFGEGFNEFQTIYMLVATGIEPTQSFVDYLNNSMEKLHHSKIRNMPNDSISIRFWELGDYSWIPYWRGLVYAFRLWGQMEHATGNVHCYKEMMHALKGSTHEMTKDVFILVVSKFIDRQQLEDEFEKYIMRAETMVLDADQLPAGCRLNHKNDGTPFIEIADDEEFREHFVL